MSISKAITRAWSDVHFKKKLVSDPHAALAEVGVKVPAGTTVKVVENTTETRHLVLPEAPTQAHEMSDEDLEKLAAAGGVILEEEVR